MTNNSAMALAVIFSFVTPCCLPASEPWVRHTIDDLSRGADGVRLADVNGDGLSDMTTGWEEGGIVRAYLNPGSNAVREAWPGVTVGKVASPEDAVFVDLDDDGATDVVSCCEGRTRTVFVHWAPREKSKYLDPHAWQTQALPATSGKQMWMFCLPMQVDGRHGVDLIVGSKGGGASVGWLQAPAEARDMSSWKFHRLAPAGWIMSLVANDVDRDGDADVIVSDRKGSGRGVYWLQNPGTADAAGGEPWQRWPIGAKGREIMFLDVAAINGKPARDIAAAIKRTDIWTFAAPPSLAKSSWIHSVYSLPGENIGTAKAVRIADVNRDGRLDAVCSCEQATRPKFGVFWFTLETASDFEGAPQEIHDISGPQGVKFDLIQLVDLDADGDLDVITCEERDQLGIVWYENPIAGR